MNQGKNCSFDQVVSSALKESFLLLAFVCALVGMGMLALALPQKAYADFETQGLSIMKVWRGQPVYPLTLNVYCYDRSKMNEDVQYSKIGTVNLTEDRAVLYALDGTEISSQPYADESDFIEFSTPEMDRLFSRDYQSGLSGNLDSQYYFVGEEPLAGYRSILLSNRIGSVHSWVVNMEQVSIKVTKHWEGTPGQPVKMVLLANAQDTGKSIVLNEENGWQGSFDNLDKYSEGLDMSSYSEFTETGLDSSYIGRSWPISASGYDNYQEILYQVMEVTTGPMPESYYEVATSKSSTDITITNLADTTSIPIQKVWNGSADKPDAVTIKVLNGDGEVVRTLELTAADDWKGTLSLDGLPRTDDDGT